MCHRTQELTAVIPLLVSSGLAQRPPAEMSLATSTTIIGRPMLFALIKLKPQ
ncbi:hypothetical protein BGZ61DRAFT_466483 [Ilyonectria robusta]|uniref:uncharacterized protein n=1 Tax=Ilyonectria robusta TaxID=1079257 RepID=UPI001E8EA443|nr:uncharacterized protein BGZ61DRAFT_466483 [Ilyonectria robusta]KAH8656441.1 hypothetical protein BGZ61DRAFT_466483 [Ilyonectria robusta]